MAQPDDTPKGIWNELQTSLVRTSIGRIALAVILAQAVLNLIRIVVWNLLMPFVAELFHHQSESVLFEQYRDKPIRWDYVVNSSLQLLMALVFVLFVSRLMRQKPNKSEEDGEAEVESANDEPTAITKGAGQ